MKKSSKQITIIGSFVIVAIALLVGLILTMGGNKWARDVIEYRIYFTTSVKGLNIGSPVMFRGISIGEVSRINLAPQRTENKKDLEDPNFDVLPVEIFVKIFPERLGYYSTNFFKFLPHNSDNIRQADNFLGNMVLHHGLRAELETLSLLTGQIYISLNFVPNTQDEQEGVVERVWRKRIIPSRLSLLDRMSKKMQENEFSRKIESFQNLLQDLADFIDQGQHKQLMADITTISRNLATVSEKLDADLPSITTRLNDLSTQLNETIVKVNAILDSVKDELPATISDTRELVGNVNGLIEDNRTGLNDLIAHLDQTILAAQTDMEQAQSLIANLQSASNPDSLERQKILSLLTECDQTMMQLRELLETLNRNPQVLFLGN